MNEIGLEELEEFIKEDRYNTKLVFKSLKEQKTRGTKLKTRTPYKKPKNLHREIQAMENY